MPLRRAVFVFIACALLPAPVAAQKLDERMAAAKTVSCTFTVRTVGNWVGGTPKADVTAPKIEVQFVEVDPDDGSAKAKGEFGSSDILVRLANGNLHFLQSFRTGPLYLTTIFPKETQAGRLMAVHTRHEYTAIALPGFTSRPEQYYGDCSLSE